MTRMRKAFRAGLIGLAFTAVQWVVAIGAYDAGMAKGRLSCSAAFDAGKSFVVGQVTSEGVQRGFKGDRQQ